MTVALTPYPCVHDGVTLEGLIALPEGKGPYSAVLVMHNALGIGAQVRAVAHDLAALGYAVIVTDMYGGAAGNLTQQQAGAAYGALLQTPERLRERVVTWYEAACAHPRIDSARIAAIGYCFGGQCVLELARSGAAVKLIVSFHGLLKTYAPAEPGAIWGEVIAWCGGNDPFAPAADIAALRTELEAAGARHEITIFDDAAHAFTDPDAGALGLAGVGYDQEAARSSWEGTLVRLSAVLDS